VDAGFTPRVQLVSTAVGAPVIPAQVRVLAYDATHTQLTLDQLPNGFIAPNAGDRVYAGGYAAPLIAAVVLG
jgi:hypothetical protein